MKFINMRCKIQWTNGIEVNGIILLFKSIRHKNFCDPGHDYTKTINIDNDTLAHAFSVSNEGGIILCRMCEDNQLLVDQIMGYRSYLRMFYDIA